MRRENKKRGLREPEGTAQVINGREQVAKSPKVCAGIRKATITEVSRSREPVTRYS